MTAIAHEFSLFASPKQSAHGLLARFCLAMLATAGFFYVNIIPALVDGLVTGLGFSTADAGSVASSNIYGAAVGALVAVFLAGRISWRMVSGSLLILLVSVDFLSSFITDANWLIGIRFGHGCIGGLLVGVAYSIFARTESPEKTFGVLLVVQYGLGGLGVMYLPSLVVDFGAPVLFWSLMLFSAVSFCLLLLLPDYPERPPVLNLKGETSPMAWWPLLATLAALFLFQAGNNGPYAVIMGLAKSFQLELDYISRWLGFAAWLGVLGAVLVIVVSTRMRRLVPMSIAMIVTAWATWSLMYSAQPGVFALANCLVGITWAFVVAYLLGMAAEFDTKGRMAALAGFASKMGLATGSLVAARMVGNEGALSDSYLLMLGVAGGILVLAWLLAMRPAYLLDKSKFTQTT